MDEKCLIAIVDDDPAVRSVLSRLLESVGMQFEAFSSGVEFLKQDNIARFDCLVLDVRMQGMSGLEIQEEIAKRHEQIPIVMITGYADVPMAVQAVKNGASDFIEKPFRNQVLLDSIHRALAQSADRRAECLLREESAERLAQLSPRERQVLERVVEGKLNKVIASELGLSPKTIEFHRANVMRKMDADSVASLVRAFLSCNPAKN